MKSDLVSDLPFVARMAVAVPAPVFTSDGDSDGDSDGNLADLVAVTPSEVLEAQLTEALHQIQTAVAQTSFTRVFQQTIFLRHYEDRYACQAFWKEHYGENLPVCVYIPQAPCGGQALVVEAILTSCSQESDSRTLLRSETLAIQQHDGVTWYCAAQQTPPNEQADIYDQSIASFRGLDDQFRAQGVPVQNVIRTWLYLGNITEPACNALEGETQRYKELNRARTDFFRGIRFFDGQMPPRKAPAYPASTGIGGNGDTLVMSALAVQFDTPDAGVILPLENPQQVSAFDYDEKYSLESPKFARALLQTNRNRGVIFVSGTASITDAESRFDDEPIAQTIQTLENIAVLIDETNLKQHGKPGFGCQLDEMAAIRVYIKRPQDYSVIREICEKEMPHVPKTYTFADVCRPELLVEIEGVALTTSNASH